MATQKQQQMSAEQMAQIKERQNSEFMRLSYLRPIKFNQENGKIFGQGKNLTFNSPIIAGGVAQNIVLQYKLNVNWKPNTNGTVKLNAAGYEALVNKLEVQYGNKQISVHPMLYTKVFDKMEGYARTTQDDVRGDREAGIDAMLRKYPTELVEGDNEVKFEVDVPLNSLHPQSVNGLIYVSTSGVRLQVGLQLASAVVGKDPLLNVFNVEGDGEIEVSGTIEPILEYRDYNSFSTTQALELDLSGLSTVQTIELPSIVGLSPNTKQYVSFRNPYNFAKIVHILIDGKQSDKFSEASNITAFSYDKAENSNSNLFDYSNATAGIEAWYKKVRRMYGTDLPEGILAIDQTSENVKNVSSKMGTSYINLSSSGFSSARAGFEFADIGHETGISSRVISYGVLINPQGIQAL